MQIEDGGTPGYPLYLSKACGVGEDAAAIPNTIFFAL